VFDIPLEFFHNYFLVFFQRFGNFEAKRAQNGFKKKTGFFISCLRFLLYKHPTVGITKLLKFINPITKNIFKKCVPESIHLVDL
jgi:hypothetical protein